jgi:sulfatase maturation enzyme AslB (radical SAM superfamily)
MAQPRFFCPLPWIHQFIEPNGIKYCCSSNEKIITTPIDFAKSEYINLVKDTIRNGRIPSGCHACVKQEQRGLLNTRTLALRDWPYTIDTVPDHIEYLDLRYNNNCNFSCRTCEPAYSTQIARENMLYPELQKYYTSTADSTDVNVIDAIQSFTNLKRINFTGGEPLLIKENFVILEHLIAQNRTDVQLLITTNASVINTKMIRLFKQFKDVHWTISLDGVEAVAEYIRHGTVWATVNNNVRQILNLKQSVSINCTVSAYSILDLSNLVKYYLDLKQEYNNQPFEIMFSVVQFPARLAPTSLPLELKDRALNHLDISISLLTNILSNPELYLNTLKHLQQNIKSVILDTSKEFLQFTNELDQIRQQNFNLTFNI